RQQDVAGCQVGGVLVENVGRELPTQDVETSHLCPRTIGHKERVGAYVEGRSSAELELITPKANGANGIEVLVECFRHKAEGPGKVPGPNFVFEIPNYDVAEIAGHSDCWAPIRRRSAG